MSVREIRTARLLLRPLGPADEEELFLLWNDREVGRYLWDDRAVARETVRAELEASQRSFAERGFGHFTLSLPPDPAVVGFSGLRSIAGSAEIEVLYALFPRFWGRGLATEAARAVLRYGFEELGLAEIFAGADPPNTASFRVMERLGMSWEGERRVGELTARYYRIRREEFVPHPGEYQVRRKE
jgi:RimJ/RimL family protein N-acetyltransferase